MVLMMRRPALLALHEAQSSDTKRECLDVSDKLEVRIRDFFRMLSQAFQLQHTLLHFVDQEELTSITFIAQIHRRQRPKIERFFRRSISHIDALGPQRVLT